MALWLYGSLFVHCEGGFSMANTTGMLLFTLLIYAAIIYGAVQLVKYFIRYGIDYYFEKLAQNQKHKEV